jgi:hypothetical protein
MTPDPVRAITDPVDATLAKIGAAIERLEAKRAGDQQDLLRQVADRLEVDPAFRYAIIALVCD